MKYIDIEDDGSRRGVPFWFAVEEYVARHWTDDDYFLIWQVEPCVMVGRNQLIDNEVNVNYCRSHGIAITRRKSGGGCIYSDAGCLLFSYIDAGAEAQAVFERRMADTARTLKAIGVEATLSGRNDILVEGHKVAGAAIYRCGSRVIMHNSLLFSTDFGQMQRCLTPSGEKLRSKGVASVSQRVGNVAEFTAVSQAAYAAEARRTLCGTASRHLGADELREVHELERYIASDRFIYGSNPSHSLLRSARIEGVGSMAAHIELHNNTIRGLNFTGDYFLLGDIDAELIARLRGVELERASLAEALRGVAVADVVRGLTAEALLRLLLGEGEEPSRPAATTTNEA